MVSSNVSSTIKLPVNGHIELAFDRFLDPLTITRQAFVLKDAFGGVVSTTAIEYDPVLREVILEAPLGVDPWLVVDQPYTLTVVLAPTGVEGAGLRSVDHATIDAQQVIGFQTTAASDTAILNEPTIDFCGDILPVFQRSCSASNCHGAETTGGDPTRTGTGPSFPAEGLQLATSDGVQNTALGRVANEANTGPHAGAPNAYTSLFATDYAVIDPGHPEQSWLLYKCLLADPGDGVTGVATGRDCKGNALTPTPIVYGIAHTAADSDERDRLGNLVIGQSMPYPYFNADGTQNAQGTLALTLDELERLRLWIKQGAATNNCTSCQ